MKNPNSIPTKRGWLQKFGGALRGMRQGARGQSSFLVHFVVAGLVVAAGLLLAVDRYEWCLLALCITLVLAAEMFNSALETLAKAIDVEHNLHLAEGLDISSAAVLLTAVGASVIGVTVFVHRLGVLLSWW